MITVTHIKFYKNMKICYIKYWQEAQLSIGWGQLCTDKRPLDKRPPGQKTTYLPKHI